jgi:lipocalin|tara:strand:+ start:17 stop:586 length:570 start_codon:yes stop_codon:yes gene_type:complete
MKILKFIFLNKVSIQKTSILLFVLFAFTTSIAQNRTIDKTVVKNFDIERYLGTWYEIARYDHYFERDLVGVTANYSFRDDGKLKVINRGYEKTLDGKKTEAIGKAKTPNKDISAELKVSFFWFFYADYFVLELDENYQWAIVGSKSDKYLWILSRTPQISKKQYQKLLKLITKRGYKSELLIKVKQKVI